MNEAEFNRAAETMIGQMKERVNLAIATAVDEKHSLEEAETILREVVDALKYYDSADIAADQLVNFSKVAFFRGDYRRALALAREAAETGVSERNRTQAAENLHSLAYSLLERAICLPTDDPEADVLGELDQVLTPADYCGALRRAAAAAAGAEDEEAKRGLAGFVRELSLEVLRQGLRAEKRGDNKAAGTLLRQALPFLNPKRAAVVKKELEKLEAMDHE